MTITRHARSPKFKFQVALEAAKGQKTLNQLASQYSLNPAQVSQWKSRLLENGSQLFENGQPAKQKSEQVEQELYEQIGRLKMELEWLKKKAAQLS